MLLRQGKGTAIYRNLLVIPLLLVAAGCASGNAGEV